MIKGILTFLSFINSHGVATLIGAILGSMSRDYVLRCLGMLP